MKTMNYKNMEYIAYKVRMGSHKMTVDIPVLADYLSCNQFIQIVLNKCNLHNVNQNLASTYVIFESYKGIERILNERDNLIEIGRTLDHYELIIRKCSLIEDRLIKTLKNDDEKEKRAQFAKKCYKQLKKVNNNKTNDDELDSNKFVNVEKVLKKAKKSAKRVHFECDLDTLELKERNRKESAKEKHKNQKNILKSLIMRLKSQSIGHSNYNLIEFEDETFNNDRSNLILTKTTTKIATSSSKRHLYKKDDNSRASSRNSSTSTLESLI